LNLVKTAALLVAVSAGCGKQTAGPKAATENQPAALHVQVEQILEEVRSTGGGKSVEGKFLQVEGAVEGVVEDDGPKGDVLALKASREEFYVLCFFPPGNRGALAKCVKGLRVAVRGTCEGVDETGRGVILKGCSLVSP